MTGTATHAPPYGPAQAPARMIPVEQLTPAGYNPRRISRRNREALRQSITRWGAVQPVVWNRRSGRIVSGHQRFDLLVAMGAREVLAVEVDLDDQEERALNLTMNATSVAGEFTAEAGDMMRGLQEFFGTEGIAEMQALVDGLAAEFDRPGRKRAAEVFTSEGLSLVHRLSVNRKRTVAFISFASWPEEDRAEQVARFKALKTTATDEQVRQIGGEIADVVRRLAGASGYRITCPPSGTSAKAGRAHFAARVARSVADQVGVEFVDIFKARKVPTWSVKPAKRDGAVVDAKAETSGDWVLVDDVATTGSTIEECARILRQDGGIVLPFVYVYRTAGTDDQVDA